MAWLPVDFAARIILDICSPNRTALRSSDPDLVYHVLNPKRFHWTRDLLPALAATGLKFEALPTDQWMEKLRNSDKDPSKNPPIKLLDFFENKYGRAATKPKGQLEHCIDETSKDSKTMCQIPKVADIDYVSMVLERLQRQWQT